jgi:hypothetical protein
VVTVVLAVLERKAHEEEAKKTRAVVDRARTAVSLRVSHAEDGSRLWVENSGLHVVRDIEIAAIPEEEEWPPQPHGPLPRLHDDQSGPGVRLTAPITGGWFLARVDQLSPGRGVQVVHYDEDVDDYQRLDIDLWWNDHEGLQRKGHVSAHLRECDGSLEMTPRDAV